MDEFTTAFHNADSLFVLEIYAASEQPIEGITGEALASRIAQKIEGAPPFPGVGKGGNSVHYVSSFDDAVSAVTSAAQSGDMILTLGAGSVSQLGPMVLERLQTKAAAHLR